MREVSIAAAQFEHRDGDKAYNLGRIAELTRSAAAQGAEFVSFHECCISGYSFLQDLDRPALSALAEPVPAGPSTATLLEIARESDVVLMAGLLEKEPQEGDEEKYYNTYCVVSPSGPAQTLPPPWHSLSTGRFTSYCCWL